MTDVDFNRITKGFDRKIQARRNSGKMMGARQTLQEKIELQKERKSLESQRLAHVRGYFDKVVQA
jgi:hypothetical protein